MKIVRGDLITLALSGDFDLIAHGCNCFCTMGAGVAKSIRTAFPAAFAADKRTGLGDKKKLGTCSYALIATGDSKLVVVNAYTQFDYRGKGVKADYAAIRSCMRWIKAHHAGKRIGLPRIGAGLAGGDWRKITAMIEDELGNEDVTLVEFDPDAH